MSQICKYCAGTGKIQWEDEIEDCNHCGGTGSIQDLIEDDSSYEDAAIDAHLNFWKDVNQHFEL